MGLYIKKNKDFGVAP